MKKFNAGLLIIFLISSFLASCSNDKAGTKSLRVRVMGIESETSVLAGVPNTTLVLGNSDGSMISYGTTDTNGEYVFTDPPANATVTAAFSCLQSGATNTTYSLKVAYDVNVPEISLYADYCKKTEYQEQEIGAITIKATNSITAAKVWDINVGNDIHWTNSLESQLTYTVYPHMLQSDGKLSIAVIGNDLYWYPVAYGILLDQTFVDGMTVDINVDKAISYVQYNVSNIPSAAKYVSAHLDVERKNIQLFTGLSSATTATTLNIPYIPDCGDQFDYSVWVDLDQNNNGINDSYVSLNNSSFPGTSPTNQNFDFSQALAVPTNLTVSYATGTTRPTISWTGTDSNTDSISLHGYSNSIFSVSMTAGPERTSVVFPELPSSLIAYLPPSINTLSLYNFGFSPGYSYTSSATFYSNTTTFAPILNKSRASLLPMRINANRSY